MRLTRLLSILTVTLCAAAIPAALHAADDGTGKFLAKFAVDPEPWLHQAADSEQRQPIYLGSTPRELALKLRPVDAGGCALYEILRERGQEQMELVREGLVRNKEAAQGDPIEFEAWPVRDERGRHTWAFARWHAGPGKPWQRLNASILAEIPDPGSGCRPVLPVTLNPAKHEDFALIFDDALTLKGLYDKPLFGNCIWTTDDGRIIEAWLPPDKRDGYGKEIGKDVKEMGSSLLCRVLPQPPRLNGKPITFIIGLDGDRAVWPANIGWKGDMTVLPGPAAPMAAQVITEWPKDLAGSFREDVLVLAGEREAVFPISKRKALFKKKNSAENDNQLQDVVAYLEERYKSLGIKTWRQDFVWRGIKQTNLIAVIPGTDRGSDPVIMAAHMDAAFCEDVFEKSGRGDRVSSPGAGDSAAATAALLMAGAVLPGLDLKHDVWLIHLTGEEAPGDRLGSRRFVGWLLQEKVGIDGAIVIDRIGRRVKGDTVFQINAGDSPGSLLMAKVAIEASRRSANGLEPVLRTRFHEQSRLPDTGGIVFSESGFPVISISAHVDAAGDIDGAAYRNSSDISQNVDWGYAVAIAKTAIETAAGLAGMASVAPPASAGAEWSLMIYAAADEPEAARAFVPWFRELAGSPVPPGLEVLIERDTEWPDGIARIARTSSSIEENELKEKDSADPESFAGFLKWAKERAGGKYTMLVIKGRSPGGGGLIQDAIVPGQEGRRSVMLTGQFASALSASGLRPDLILFDMPMMGSVEAVEELKGASPYLVVSQFDSADAGFPPAKLLNMLAARGMGPDEIARALPEAYAAEYAHDGTSGPGGGGYSPVGMASIDTAKWDEFAHKFKMLTSALGGSGFAEQLSAQPGWPAAIADAEGNADLVELLNRIPLITDDLASRSIAAEILDDIGYPERVAAESASTITIDPGKVRSFELRIEAPADMRRDQVVPRMAAAWSRINRDLGIPEGLTYDFADFKEGGKSRREFIVRCPGAVLKKAMVLRAWLAGAKYVILTTVDLEGRTAEKRYFRDRDFFSAREFPHTSFLVGEAHSQGAPFAHGVSISLKPGARSGAGFSGEVPYGSTAWNARTGWGDMVLSVSSERNAR